MRPVECGTRPGYNRHRYLQQPQCDPCRAAQSAHDRDRYAGEASVTPRELPACGTAAAYDRHRRLGEPTCLRCRDGVAVRRLHNNHERTQHRRYIAARGRAMTRVAQLHPQDMAQLLAEELGDNDLVERNPRTWKATG